MSIPFFYWCYTNHKIIHNLKSKISKTTETPRITLIHSRSQKLNWSWPVCSACCAVLSASLGMLHALQFAFTFGLDFVLFQCKWKWRGKREMVFIFFASTSLDISHFVVSNGWNVRDGNEKNNYLIMHSSFLFQLTANLISNLLFIVYNVIFIQFSFLQYEI